MTGIEEYIERGRVGAMASEWREACRAIDEVADRAVRDCLAAAMEALLANNPGERDRLCDKAERAEATRMAAKKEAWFRLGEAHGIDRESAERALRRLGMGQ